MKNIYVWPTKKPSRVYRTNLGNYYFVESYVPDTVQTFKNHNIYITSNEEISLWDWYLMEFNGLQITQCTSDEELTSIEGRGDCIKIALTTDYDLIQSGVQSVDDEFLKWFVKNPGCEEVEVVYDYFQVDQSWSQVLQGSTSLAKRHKIIIPKEQKEEEQLLTNQFIDYPPELEPVLAKISHHTHLGHSLWFEVVYWADNKWGSYSGSKTFDDGEQVLEWVSCYRIFENKTN